MLTRCVTPRIVFHMTTTTPARTYLGRTLRAIPGTTFRSALMYASSDRSIREYVLFDADGHRLGEVAWHPARIGLSAGYHEGHGSRTFASRTYSSLTDAATEMAAR